MTLRLLSVSAVLLTATALSGCVGVNVTAQERPFDRAFADVSVRTDLNARMLANDPRLFANVSTTVLEGRVHLAGTVDTEADKTRAAQMAATVPGVKEVINNIEVTSEGGLIETVDDRWIAGQVRARILADGAIRDSNYTIDTQNNVVYVMGIAQDAAELDRVLKHAAVVRGVRQVVNYAVLKTDPNRFEAPTAAAPVLDPIRIQESGAQPPVLSDDPGQGFAAQGALPQPVEVTPLPTDPSRATRAPKSLLK